MRTVAVEPCCPPCYKGVTQGGPSPVTVAPADFSLLERFHAHLADERRLSPNTVQAYRRDLEQLVTFLGRAHGSLASATHDDLRRFLAQQTTRGYARASIARRVGAIRTTCPALIRQAVGAAVSSARANRPSTNSGRVEATRPIRNMDATRDESSGTVGAMVREA